MNNMELMEVRQNIFTKIKNFFKKIFIRNHKEIIPNANSTVLTQYSSSDNNQKEQFFDLYKKIKTGNVNVFNVDIDKLQKVCQMLEEECKLKEMRLKNTKDEIDIHRRNVMCYKSITNS